MNHDLNSLDELLRLQFLLLVLAERLAFQVRKNKLEDPEAVPHAHSPTDFFCNVDFFHEKFFSLLMTLKSVYDTTLRQTCYMKSN